MTYIVCYSGGHASALVAIETVRKYGKDNVILLNHNISPEVEHEDIKRFKNEVANYLGIEITYANLNNWEQLTPLKLCEKEGGFKFNNSPVICTSRLKTQPFHKYLKENWDDKKSEVTILYGFDENEKNRITRRSQIMGLMGYKTQYPLCYWERTIYDTEEIGIKKPSTYELHKHANCIGCLKSGQQSWYLTYCLYPHIFNEAMKLEKKLGYSIIKDNFLEDLEPKFAKMKCLGILPNENDKYQSFWSMVRKMLKENENTPCECSF